MQTETTKPLWKVLNEKRTQGEWYCEEGSFIVRRHIAAPICEFNVVEGEVNNNKRVANAQYTALAVNNLHILAEAINTALKSTSSNNNDKIEIEFEALQGLQSALARIS